MGLGFTGFRGERKVPGFTGSVAVERAREGQLVLMSCIEPAGGLLQPRKPSPLSIGQTLNPKP